MNPSKQFVFQRWNPKEQKLELDPDRNALSVEQIQQLLQELGTHCTDSIITKFNSVRKLKKEPERKRESRIRSRNRPEVPGSTSSTGAADTAGKLHGVEPCGSANAPTIPEETRSGGGPPKGPGGRVDGSSSGTNRKWKPAPQKLPRDLLRMKMRNNSNTCYLNSTVFSVLWQVPRESKSP